MCTAAAGQLGGRESAAGGQDSAGAGRSARTEWGEEGAAGEEWRTGLELLKAAAVCTVAQAAAEHFSVYG